MLIYITMFTKNALIICFVYFFYWCSNLSKLVFKSELQYFTAIMVIYHAVNDDLWL